MSAITPYCQTNSGIWMVGKMGGFGLVWFGLVGVGF
jgi:hypothetical protein